MYSKCISNTFGDKIGESIMPKSVCQISGKFDLESIFFEIG